MFHVVINRASILCERLRASLDDALQAIAATVEMRDTFTAGHYHRVADLVVSIAQKIGLPEEPVHGIHLIGIIHDLGMIYVPAEILNRPGQLSENEMYMIKTHA